MNKKVASIIGLFISTGALLSSMPSVANNQEKYTVEDNEIKRKYADNNDAIKVLESRMEFGDMNARYDLFVIYYNGYGVNKNTDRAKHVLNYCTSQKCNDRKQDVGLKTGFEKSFDTVKITGQRTDGNGQGVDGVAITDPWKKDFSMDDKNNDGIPDEIESEATLGNRYAQYKLGLIHFYGDGKAVNYPEARKWLGLAALKLIPEAVMLMGEIYEKGIGVEKDNAQALSWYRLAKYYDEDSVRDIIIRIIRKMDKEGPGKKNSKPVPTKELSYKIKDDVIARALSYTLTGETLSIGESTELKVNKHKEFYQNRINDLGWKVSRTDVNDVYILSRKLSIIGPFDKNIEYRWQVNGFKGDISELK